VSAWNASFIFPQTSVTSAEPAGDTESTTMSFAVSDYERRIYEPLAGRRTISWPPPKR